MARRRKRLVDLVRDATFLARKDEHLLASHDPFPWPGLEALRERFRAVDGDADARRDVALELERGLRAHPPSDFLGELQADLRKLGPPGSFERVAGFARTYFRHYAGPRAGEPFVFDPFQADFLREFCRRRKNGRRVYTVALWMLPKGNGKTPTAAVLGTEALVSSLDAPEVYDVAGSRDQADICQSFARANIEDGKLAAWLDVGSDVIRCDEHRGEYEILSSDGDLAAGINPTAFIADELWLFLHRKQREAWNSGVKALPKRAGRSWALGISTAGYTKDSLLGEMYDAVMAHPQLELREDGFLQVLRDEGSRFLFWGHGVPDGVDADIEDPALVRAVNPAPWIEPGDLLAELHQPGTDESDWRRLHLNQWTLTKRSWLSSGIWARLSSATQIPEGAEILLGIDAARTWDTTSVAWAWVAPDGRKVTRAHVWSVRPNVPHHTFVPGGELVNEELVEPFVAELAKRYLIRGIALDPRYLNAEAKHLADAGFTVVKVEPWSAPMQDAVALFEKDVLAGAIKHDGDRVVSLHMDAIDSERRPDGAKKIGKRSERNPIDAGIALILANYLSAIELPAQHRSWRPL